MCAAFNHVCFTAVESGVQRLVIASSLRVISGLKKRGCNTHRGWRRADQPLRPQQNLGRRSWRNVRPRPRTLRDPGANRLVSAQYRRSRRLASNPQSTSLYFSHSDAALFFARCVGSPTPDAGESASVFATSKPADQPRLDLEPARTVLDYEPEDTWPAGMPFPHE